MEKTLVFDMDGTIADLYGVKNWLEMILDEDATPYKIAKPLYDMIALNEVVTALKNKGWRIVVTTWLAKGSTKAYDKLVREAKLTWLEEMNFPYDEIHLVKYGTTKANCTRHHGGFQILVDDNEKVRKGWNLGNVIDANHNILKELIALLQAVNSSARAAEHLFDPYFYQKILKKLLTNSKTHAIIKSRNEGVRQSLRVSERCKLPQ